MPLNPHYILMCLCLFFFGISQAQEEEMWVQLGLSNSHFYNDSLDTRPLNSPLGGMGASWKFDNGLRIQTGVLYSQRGFQSSDQNARLTNEYLDVIGMGQYQVLPGLYIGPHARYASLLSSKIRVKSQLTNFESQTRILTSFRSSFEWGLGMNVELEEGLELTCRVDNLFPSERAGRFAEVGLTFNPEEIKSNSMAAQDRAEAFRHILEMKESVLFVRLKTMEHSIAALRVQGRDQQADNLEAQIRNQNERIVRAFNEHYTFTPVYFFYSYNSNKVMNGDFTNSLLDGVDLPIQQELPADSKYYIADFGILEPDTATFFMGYDWIPDGNFSRKKIRREYRATTFRFGALKVKGPDFVQLRSPFPFWVKTYGQFLFKRDPNAIVIRFEEKLQDFFERAVRTDQVSNE